MGAGVYDEARATGAAAFGAGLPALALPLCFFAAGFATLFFLVAARFFMNANTTQTSRPGQRAVAFLDTHPGRHLE
jgi:hypothetical protein